MNTLSEIIKNILKSNNFKFDVMVPSKSLLCIYKEEQNLYGITKKIVVTNNHHNVSFVILTSLKNDFYENSEIDFYLTKPIISEDKMLEQKLAIEKLYTGKNQETNVIFEKLKNEFYDPYIKIPVPPKN